MNLLAPARPTLDAVLSRLPGYRRSGRGYVARCPAHDDRNPSLGVWPDPDRAGRVILKCFAGCSYDDVLAALGFDAASSPAFPASAPYPSRPLIPAADETPGIDWRKLNRQCKAEMPAWALRAFAGRLGLPAAILRRIETGHHAGLHAHTWPMRDGTGRIIGMRTRYVDNTKRAVNGSHNGLFVPRGLPERTDLLLLPEGVTSTAAALAMGFDAVGRPNCSARPDLAAAVVAALRPGCVAVVGENDQKDDGRWPGRDGAWLVARFVARVHGDVRVVMPPAGVKDLRDWLLSDNAAGLYLRRAVANAPRVRRGRRPELTRERGEA